MDNNYRNKISTVDEQGKRVWLFPKKPAGAFFNKRKIVSYGLLLMLLCMPFIKLNGKQLLLFNILERKFILFGQVFYPQDFSLFAISMVLMVAFVGLFTLAYGRIFCGWICPQTIFMEMVFRQIEYWIDGDANQQRKLWNLPMQGAKLRKRILKHSIFYIISFLLGNIFLAYIISADKLIEIMIDAPAKHIGGLISILIFSTIFYLVFSKMREQVCTIVCPYGRLQGVLVNNATLSVVYDFIRGEKRAKISKGEDRETEEKGDCVDCGLCVQVCPTGIDIRNGTQLECVNCTACIDACDTVMEKVGFEKGLIRYDSIEGVETRKRFSFTPRIVMLTALMAGVLIALISLLATRADVEVVLLRTRGTLFQKINDQEISNLFDINIINKTDDVKSIEIKLIGSDGYIKMIGNNLKANPGAESQGKFMLIKSKESLSSNKEKVLFGIYANGELIDEVKCTYVGPLI